MKSKLKNEIIINDSIPLDYSNMEVSEFSELLLEIP